MFFVYWRGRQHSLSTCPWHLRLILATFSSHSLPCWNHCLVVTVVPGTLQGHPPKKMLLLQQDQLVPTDPIGSYAIPELITVASHFGQASVMHPPHPSGWWQGRPHPNMWLEAGSATRGRADEWQAGSVTHHTVYKFSRFPLLGNPEHPMEPREGLWLLENPQESRACRTNSA